MIPNNKSGVDAGFWKGRGYNLLGLHAKRGGGGSGGPALVPMLKSLHREPKGGGADPMECL